MALNASRCGRARAWPTLLLAAGVPVSAAFRTEAIRDPATGRKVGEAVEGQVLVKYRRGPPARGLAPLSEEPAGGLSGTEKLGELEAIGWTHLKLPPGVSVEAALQALRADPRVEAAEPNRLYYPLRVPNDPSYPAQFGLSNLSAPAAWEFGVGESTTVTVAVIDTGIDGSHPDLQKNLHATLNRRFDSTTGAGTNENPPTDLCGHGTGVASVAAADADNSLMISGVSWKAKLLSLRVFTSGCLATSEVTISSAVSYAVSLATGASSSTVGRMVLNLSLGSADAVCSQTSRDAMALALSNNIPVVAAAGNQSVDNPGKIVTCPGKVTGVIAVGATDASDNIGSFSAVGSGQEVWVTAPGVSILTARRTDDGGGLMSQSGTSFASPHVAGLVALMLSEVPTLSTAAVRSNLQQTADDLGPQGYDTRYGFGRANAFKAMRLAVRGTLADFAGQTQVVAFPNPARFSRGSATFVLPPGLQGSGLSIRVFTMAGESVRTLTGLTWDGRNDAGAEVATGVYLFLVETERGKAAGRLAVVH